MTYQTHQSEDLTLRVGGRYNWRYPPGKPRPVRSPADTDLFSAHGVLVGAKDQPAGGPDA